MARANSRSFFSAIVGGGINSMEPKFSFENRVICGPHLHFPFTYGNNYVGDGKFWWANNSIGVVTSQPFSCFYPLKFQQGVSATTYLPNSTHGLGLGSELYGVQHGNQPSNCSMEFSYAHWIIDNESVESDVSISL